MFLTFDIGTTTVKTALFDRAGRLLRIIRKDYSLDSPHPDWYEIDPATYWSAVCEGIRDMHSLTKLNPNKIRGISGCSQGETIILLDKHGNPVRPAIVWMDKRCREEAAELSSLISVEELYSVTGISEMDTTWSAPKILWVKNHEPDVFEKVDRILLVEDYIVYQLTGEMSSTASLLSSSALIDIVKKKYWDIMIKKLDIGGRMPAIIQEGSIVGRIKRNLAEELLLPADAIVVKGSMDQVNGAIGTGNLSPGTVTETSGSALAVMSTIKRFNPIPKIRIPCQPHLLPDRYLMLPFSQSGGIMHSWFVSRFVADSTEIHTDASTYHRLDDEVLAVPAGSDGLVVLPFIAGASYPNNNPHAKGVIYGLTLRHGKNHIVRAIMESIGYLLKDILSLLSELGIDVREIKSTGGGARSDVWLQIKADICNIPFVKMVNEDAASVGAAIMAAVALGEYPTIHEAVNEMVQKGPSVKPSAPNSAAYASGYRLYREVYQRLKPVFSSYKRR